MVTERPSKVPVAGVMRYICAGAGSPTSLRSGPFPGTRGARGPAVDGRDTMVY